MKKIYHFIFLVFIFVFVITAHASPQEGFEIYYKAKKCMYQRDYEKALEYFEQLKTEFPHSRYIDDVEFYTAYIWERQGKYAEAFDAYNKFKKKFAQSLYVDDAVVQQISIAEKLARKGQKKYINFIVKFLSSPDKIIKYQASISLAKLHDKRALPGLNQMINNGDQDMSRVAKSLIKNFDAKPTSSKTRLKTLPDKNKNSINRGKKIISVKQPKLHQPDNRSGNTPKKQIKRKPSAKIKQPISRSYPKTGVPAIKAKSPRRSSSPQKSTLTKQKK